MTDMTTTTEPMFTGEIQNTCTCTKYDPVTEEYTDEPADYCDASCWDFAVEDFANCTEHLRALAVDDLWKVEGIALWNRTVGGYFRASKVDDIIRGMAVDSMWTMRFSVYADRVEYSLSHHDAPTGSSSVLTPFTGDPYEEGLEYVGR